LRVTLLRRVFAAARDGAGRVRNSSAASVTQGVAMQVSWLTVPGSHAQQPVYTTLPPHLSKQVLATKHSVISHIPALPPCPLPPVAGPPAELVPPRPPSALRPPEPAFAGLEPPVAGAAPAVFLAPPLLAAPAALVPPLPALASLDENFDEQARHTQRLAAPSQKPPSSECPRARLMLREYHALG